nr:glutathione S-transferase PARB-like [Ipomoea trifida]
MAIKVHGNKMSTATMRVVACLMEKGLDFQFVDIDMGADQHKQEPFLSLNPFGQVPAFEDGDLKLFESRAITQYIAYTCANKGSQLVCEDPKKMSTASVWMEVENHHFDPAASALTWELGIKPLIGMATDDTIVEQNKERLSKVLDVYENRLIRSKYLGGDSFSLADLHHLPNMHCLMGTQVKTLFESRPNVSAWCADISSRPAWLKTVEWLRET